MKYKRGDLVWIDTPNQGENHLQKNIRPAVILSNNIGNMHSDIAVVSYITGKIKRMDMPTHVIINSMDHPSVVLLEQLDTISEEHILNYAGSGSVWIHEMMAIENALRISLGLS